MVQRYVDLLRIGGTIFDHCIISARVRRPRFIWWFIQVTHLDKFLPWSVTPRQKDTIEINNVQNIGNICHANPKCGHQFKTHLKPYEFMHSWHATTGHHEAVFYCDKTSTYYSINCGYARHLIGRDELRWPNYYGRVCLAWFGFRGIIYLYWIAESQTWSYIFKSILFIRVRSLSEALK